MNRGEKEGHRNFARILVDSFMFSAFYCLHGYIFQQKQSSRPPQESDVPLMSSLLRSDNYYQLINWFDLSNSSS